MNSTSLFLLIAAGFFVMFTLGWFSRLLLRHIRRSIGQDSIEAVELEGLEADLIAAEHDREEALQMLAEQEQQFTSNVRQLEADLEAAMEGLGNARREAEYYRSMLQDTQGK